MIHKVLLTMVALLVPFQGKANSSWLLFDLPSTYELSSMKEIAKSKNGQWQAELCFKTYNRSNPGDMVLNIPTKKSDNEINSDFFVSDIDEATFRVDWTPVAKAQIHWFDSSFAAFDNGKPRPVETTITRDTFGMGFKGYKICSRLPFEDKYPLSYLKKKLNHKIPVGLVVWQSDFILDYFYKKKKMGSQRYRSKDILTPVFGSIPFADRSFTADVKDVFRQVNMVSMLKVADEAIEADSIEEFMRVKELRHKKKRIQKSCGALPTEELELGKFAEELRYCTGGF